MIERLNVAWSIVPKVVDLSHWDDVQDGLAGAKAFGIRGVINKVTEGLGGEDHSFSWRRAPAAKQGLLYGAYHFIRPGRILQQVDWFLSRIGDTTDLLLALDHEDPNVPLSDAQLWMQAVHDKVGRWPVLYSGFLIKEQLRASDHPFWSNIKLWLSHYSDKPTWPNAWKTPWLWQYSGDGLGPTPHNVPGIVCGRGIDMNSFSGTDDELAAQWAAPDSVVVTS